MTQPLVIKVDYVLGDKSAFQQASQMADQHSRQAQNNMRQETATAISSQQQIIQNGTRAYNVQVGQGAKPKSMLETFLSGGIGGMLKGAGLAGAVGLAAYGAAGTIASDVVNLGKGGAGLRGHGFAGMLDSIYGHLSGRATREATQDFRMERGAYAAEAFGMGSQYRYESDTLKRSAFQRQISEVDPLLRTQFTRNKLGLEETLQRGQLQQANQVANIIQDETQKVNASGNIDDIINNLKMQVSLQEDINKRASDLLNTTKERVNLENEALTSRKQTIKDDANKFGTMTPEERMFATSAAMDLKEGKQLTPEQISSLSGFGSAQQDLNKYLRRTADESGYTDFLKVAGDQGISKAATVSQENNISVEAALDEQALADAIWEKSKGEIGNLIKTIKVSAGKSIDLKEQMEKLKVQRATLAGTQKE